MYIHNYQIHNVLNTYRKQLIQSPGKASARRSSRAVSGDVVTPSKKGPPALVNRISTEIIDRLARLAPQSKFDNTLADQIAESKPNAGQHKNINFTYTLIDEQNRKTTHTLPMDSLNGLKYQEAQNDQPSSDTAKEQPPVKVLFDNNQDKPNKWKG